MAIQVQGFGGITAEVDGQTWRALRVTPRPIEFGALGCYVKGLTSGVMAAGLGAASNIYSYRWGDATRLAIVTNVRISVGSIAAFTPGIVTLALKVGRSFSVAHTGGTAGTLTTNNSKLRTSMGTMLLSDVRIASTAALAGGTVTLDTDAASAITTSVTASAGIGIVAPGTEIWNIEGHSEHPLVFAQNEGFTLQGTVPATGTWTFSVSTKWYEVASY